MREIVMDTETTGLDPSQGDRIVEIGGVELINHLPTGQTYHQYINPERSMPREAFEVHGLGDDFLRPYPVFSRIADAFLEFVGDAKLVIHNASFDMMFLNAELGWLGKPPLPMDQAIDTLAIARRKFPGAQASLDALCKRFGVDNSAREKHGALLDSEILAEVYLELLGGRQQGLTLSAVTTAVSTSRAADWVPPPRPRPLTIRVTDAERAAHAEFVAELGDKALWTKGSQPG
ncbi:MAG: DNA polymerase III subunit epsilon [Paracoccaceae bacterium]